MVDQVLGIALRKSVRRTKNHDGYFEDACTGILRKSKEIIVLDVPQFEITGQLQDSPPLLPMVVSSVVNDDKI